MTTEHDPRAIRDMDYAWHGAVNQHANALGHENWPKFMYQAKSAWSEAKRLPFLFRRERMGELPKTFRRCSCCSDSKHVVDNHLTCCLGVECRKCPHLLALETKELTPSQIDEAKAWTCIGHILSKGGDPAGEGFILTTDDRMYWDGVYENLAGEPPKFEEGV